MIGTDRSIPARMCRSTADSVPKADDKVISPGNSLTTRSLSSAAVFNPSYLRVNSAARAAPSSAENVRKSIKFHPELTHAMHVMVVVHSLNIVAYFKGLCNLGIR